MEQTVNRDDPRYPALLRQLGDAPKQLYYKGSWNPELFEKCLAVVGTRRMTSYGKRVTEQIVGEIASAGVTIVSGFMYGIDAEAHKAALRVGGKTIAVMPCGIDVIHPEYQADLYQEILETGGLVVSEYEGTHPAVSWTFPRRNRIVAGLSRATLVVEAGEESGALITANLAKKHGRKVFAFPNPLTSAVSAGVTQLLKEGAALAGSAKDILQYYGIKAQNTGTKTQTKHKAQNTEHKPESLEGKIVQQLARESLHIDELARKLGVKAGELGAVLSLLELEGCIGEEEGKYHMQ